MKAGNPIGAGERLIDDSPGTPESSVERLDGKICGEECLHFQSGHAGRTLWKPPINGLASGSFSSKSPQPASGPSAAGGISAGGTPPQPPRPSKLSPGDPRIT
jgi:hypothetical protein